MTSVPARNGLPAGKLPSAELEAALARITSGDPRLLVGPRVGEDAAVIDMGGGRCLVVATDPITFATERIGWYAVHVNANDIAVMGARPAWFFAVVLMPEGTTAQTVHAVLDDIASTCAGLDITLAGGHTEITAGLPRPLVVGQMVGEAGRDELVTKAGVRAGDQVVLAQGAAIEGTALLAREMAPALERRVGAPMLERARRLLFDPGISVLRAARLATGAGRVHAMHDPTEGGVLTGLHELASAGGLGLRAWADRIPIFPETRAICAALDVDPLILIASGALLVAAAPADAERVARALNGAGIRATVVAELRRHEEGILLERSGTALPFVPPARDEIARVLGT